MGWVNELVGRLDEAKDGILEVEVGGQKIVAKITQDFVSYFKENKKLLQRVGKRVFLNFLLLLNEKKQEQAFNLLLAHMTAQDIIQRLQNNAMSLAEQTKLTEEFHASMKKFAISTLTPTLIKLMIGLLV